MALGNTGRTDLIALSRWRLGFESRTGCRAIANSTEVRGPLPRVSFRFRPPLPMKHKVLSRFIVDTSAPVGVFQFGDWLR
jgi:hypothetical protein